MFLTYCFGIVLVFSVFSSTVVSRFTTRLAILDTRVRLKSTVNPERKCIFYDPMLAELPSEHEAHVYKPIFNVSEGESCTTSGLGKYNNSIIYVGMSGNCSFAEKISNITASGIDVEAIFLWNSSFSNYLDNVNSSSFPITFVMAFNTPNVTNREGILFGINEGFLFDYSLIVIWLIAYFVIVVGSIWSSSVRHGCWIQQISNTSVTPRQGSSNEHISPFVSVVSTLLIISFIVGFLLLAYFLPTFMYYVIVCLFFIGSVSATYTCCLAAAETISFTETKVVRFRTQSIYLHQVLCFAFALSLGILWIIFKDSDPTGWILQDILGVAFTVSIMRNCVLPNLFIITCLSVGLLVYDIFFVFVSPLFTANGESIMVEVATGGGEFILPMVFRIPHIVFSAYPECQTSTFSLLGFGDVIVPGFLAAFSATYDRMCNGGKLHIYFMVCTLGYGLGLVLTFIVLFLMKSAQPALLYLVPTTLIPVLVTAVFRHDLRHMWSGDVHLRTAQSIDPGSSHSTLAE